MKYLWLTLLLLVPTCVQAQDTVKEADQLDFAAGLLSRGMYDMAIAQYQKFITDYPHSQSLQEAYLSLGEGYFLSQDFTKAVDTFNQFQKLFPNSDQMPVSVLRLGQIAIQQKDYDGALKELGSVDLTKLKGEMLQAFDYYMGQAYAGKSDTANALSLYQKATQVDGTSTYTPDAYEQIGLMDAQTAKYADAQDAYNKGMQATQDPAFKDELTYRMAEGQFMAGQYPEAIKDFQQLIDHSSSFAKDAMANMFLAYYNLGQYDQLLAAYTQDLPKIKDDESYFTVHFSAVLAYIELKKFDEANKLLDHILTFPDLKPRENAKIFIKKADILIQQKKYQDGLSLLNAYASDNVDNVDETTFFKAEAEYGLADYSKAYDLFGSLVTNFPNSRFAKAALLGQAHAQQLSGHFKESEALFLKYYGLQDDQALKSDALFDAIMVADRSGDNDGLIHDAQDYLKNFPAQSQASDVLLILANTYDKANQPQKAVDLLQSYLGQNPTPQRPNSIYFLLAFNEELAGKSDQALADYAKVDRQKEDGKFYFGALKNIAIIYLTQKKEDEAKTYFDQLITQAGQNDLQIKTYVWVCNEYLKEQKFSDVLRIAALAEKHFQPQDLQKIKYFEGEALRALGRCDQASQDYDTVIASSDKNVYTASAEIGQALCVAKAQKYDDAKKEFQKALDENPDDYTITAHARYEMANVELAQGHKEEALKLYLLVATIYENDEFCSQSLLNAAQISAQLGKKDDARKMYQEILDKYKNTPAASVAQERIKSLK